MKPNKLIIIFLALNLVQPLLGMGVIESLKEWFSGQSESEKNLRSILATYTSDPHRLRKCLTSDYKTIDTQLENDNQKNFDIVLANPLDNDLPDWLQQRCFYILNQSGYKSTNINYKFSTDDIIHKGGTENAISISRFHKSTIYINPIVHRDYTFSQSMYEIAHETGHSAFYLNYCRPLFYSAAISLTTALLLSPYDKSFAQYLTKYACGSAAMFAFISLLPRFTKIGSQLNEKYADLKGYDYCSKLPQFNLDEIYKKNIEESFSHPSNKERRRYLQSYKNWKEKNNNKNSPITFLFNDAIKQMH